MTAPVIKGFCPGALRPMMSGDGLVVRIRPFCGRLSAAQAFGLATLSATYGNGIIDLSSRANVQLRGVASASHAPLIEGLRALGLIDATEAIESRRNVVTTPFWKSRDVTEMLTHALTSALGKSNAPAIPHKFGFAIDTGPTPVLQNTSADIRLERDATGALILVADGMTTGKPINAKQSIDEALALGHWFMAHRTTENRMAKLLLSRNLKGFDAPRQSQSYTPQPGPSEQGTFVGLAFGQLTAETLKHLAALGALRITPWRLIFVEGIQDMPDVDGVIADPNDPLLRITACTGAPDCDQALDATRPLARKLAPHLRPEQALHISGCAKGCAHPKSAPLTLTATKTGFDLVKQGRAGDIPAATSLNTDDIIKAL